ARKHDPVVLIVPGSGPTDRNGNSPLGIKANTYRLLAEGLAARHISSVRVDKRGMFASKDAGDGNAVSIPIYAADYHAWIDAIRAQTGAKCVWLLGHSEGALMVSATAEGRKDVCGLILVSGAGRPVLDVMREQLQANPANAPILPEALHAIDELKAGRHVDVTGINPVLLRLFAPQVQDFMMSAYAADPVVVLRKAHKRTLILQGTTDLQTSAADAQLLDAAPRTKLVMLDGVNHVLKEAPLDRAANLATYTDPDLPIPNSVTQAIAHFVKDDN
ncbi:MAG: alpha/beta fold hydrolase, partial [Alphaproteobacteria bacterium]